VVAVMIGGGLKMLQKVRQLVDNYGTAVLVLEGSGGLANFIAEAYRITKRPLVN